MYDYEREAERFLGNLYESEICQQYFKQKENIKQYPELKVQIDEFRKRNYKLQNDDIKKITAIPGIGTKTAQRLVLELKDRCSSIIIPVTTLIKSLSLNLFNNSKYSVLSITLIISFILVYYFLYILVKFWKYFSKTLCFLVVLEIKLILNIYIFKQKYTTNYCYFLQFVVI